MSIFYNCLTCRHYGRNDTGTPCINCKYGELYSPYVTDTDNVITYITNDVEITERLYRNMVNSLYGANQTRKLEIKNVIFNNPATIVFWSDNTKTVVKCANEEFDPEKGLAMAIAKKFLGNKGNYFNEIKKWTDTCEVESDYPSIELPFLVNENFDPVCERLSKLTEALKDKRTLGGD